MIFFSPSKFVVTKFDLFKHFFEIQSQVTLGDEIKICKVQKGWFFSPIRGQNKKTRHPSNFHDNSAPGDVAFQNLRSSNGSGPTGGGDEIKPKKAKKMTKKTFFDALCKAQFYIYTFYLKIESSLICILFIWSLMQVY